jgi:hypothetical protein
MNFMARSGCGGLPYLILYICSDLVALYTLGEKGIFRASL